MPHFLKFDPSKSPLGETSDLCSNQRQSTAPLLGGVGGGQNSWENSMTLYCYYYLNAELKIILKVSLFFQ